MNDYLFTQINSSNLEIYARSGDPSYIKRLVCRWNEKISDTGKVRSHIYAAVIDNNNQVYVDCRKRLIFTKIVVSTSLRPLYALLKTCYHLSMFPVAKAIFLAYREKISWEQAYKKSINSICDIARTPIYQTAMTIVGVVGIIVAPFHPKTLYKFREIIGKTEQVLCRHNFLPLPVNLTICFHPIKLDKIMVMGNFKKERIRNEYLLINYRDTDYGVYSIDYLLEKGLVYQTLNNEYLILDSLTGSEQIELEEILKQRALMHHARALIHQRRHHYIPFYKIFGKLDSNQTFKSVACKKIIEIS